MNDWLEEIRIKHGLSHELINFWFTHEGYLANVRQDYENWLRDPKTYKALPFNEKSK